MSELRELYQQVILDHNRNPRNRGPFKDANRHAEGFNPLCGDHVHLHVLERDGVIERATFEGNGCAISTAAASTMTEAIAGKTTGEAHEMFRRFHAVVTGQEAAEEILDLGKLAAFAGVAEFPMRVKCATLVWHAMENALAGTAEVARTE